MRVWRRAKSSREMPPALRDDPVFVAAVEAHERAAMDCVMCDLLGEPHVCEREWWRQRAAHLAGRTCRDDECPCHEAARLRSRAARLDPAFFAAPEGSEQR